MRHPTGTRRLARLAAGLALAGALGAALIASALATDLGYGQATFIDAFNIVRYVENRTPGGPALFISVKTLAEWQSFLAGVPAGSFVAPACRTMTVNICGAARNVPYARLGEELRLAGGYNRSVTYICANTTNGLAKSSDTSWLEAASGQCDPPPPSTCPATTLSWVGDARCGDQVPEAGVGASFQLEHRSAKNTGRATATCRLVDGAPSWVLTNAICSHDGNEH